jgi:hypothetical protein
LISDPTDQADAMSLSQPRRIPFRVDIAGVIEILGSSLYSQPEAAVRELIQNAHDAVMRRRRGDLGYLGRIDVEQDAEGGLLRFSDDGIGLSEDEAETYLSTVGIGITGFLKGRDVPAPGAPAAGDGQDLIGQFGIGLLSAFMLASRLAVESRKLGAAEAVRWVAGADSEIELSASDRAGPGTTVTLALKPEHLGLARDAEKLEELIKAYADFLPVPIHLNGSKSRVNVANATWFDPTPDREAVELDLEGYFRETPLDVIAVRRESPARVAGALYVTPRRTPGFAGDAVVTATARRMVISRQVQGLLPEWASFLRGVLELGDCSPTLSREDVVRDEGFERTRATLEALVFEHFEKLADSDPPRWQSVLAWHRYTLAGSALANPRLRALCRRTYRLPTSRGEMTFDEILAESDADPLFEAEAEKVVWFNADRRQERWANSLFQGQEAPCVHALRSFEESLLAAWTADANGEGTRADLRLASPGSANFAEGVLNVSDLEDAPEPWAEFLEDAGAKVRVASFRDDLPVMAFLNERSELARTFEDLRTQGAIPSGFQRMIDAHLAGGPSGSNEVLLNRRHRLVGRALERSTAHPLASVLRLLVGHALGAAGAAPTRALMKRQDDDLNWIAEALWGRRS